MWIHQILGSKFASDTVINNGISGNYQGIENLFNGTSTHLWDSLGGFNQQRMGFRYTNNQYIVCGV